MANIVKLKRSAVASAVPTTAQIDLGELAINTFDGKLFLKKNNGTESIVEIGKAPSVQTITSAATITPNANTDTQVSVTALAVSATIATPSGTPVDGQKLMLRFEDNGTARALTWTTSAGAYRAVGLTLPTTTTATKVLYVGCIYNAADGFWDVIAKGELA